MKKIPVIVVAIVVAVALRAFFLEGFRIISSSMEPGLLLGDLVFVSKLTFGLHMPFSNYELVKIRRPERFEVVAFSHPDVSGRTVVKRVVATENDKVSIVNGVLKINDDSAFYRTLSGEIREEIRGASYPVYLDVNTQDFGPVDVPKGHFFVLGDNRVESRDSRHWGPIPFSLLKGKVSIVWLSLDTNGHMRSERLGLRVE